MNLSSASVSIILVHTGNHSILASCLASIAKQTLLPVQVLVLTDKPESIMDITSVYRMSINTLDCEKNDAWIARGKNRAMLMCEGELIYFMASNHTLGRNCLRELTMRMFESDVPAIAYSSFEFANNMLTGMKWGFEFNNYHILNRHLVGEAYLVKKDSLVSKGVLFNENISNSVEDWDLHIRLSKAGFHFLYYPHALYRYNRHEGTIFPPAQSWYEWATKIALKNNPDVYNYQYLCKTKRTCAPGLQVISSENNRNLLTGFMNLQSFMDWSMECNANLAPYRLEVLEYALLEKLSPEALESAVLYLETEPGFSICRITWLGKTVLQISRQIGGNNLYRYGNGIKEINCTFADTAYGELEKSQEKSRLTGMSSAKSDIELLRNKISKRARTLLGSRISHYLISKYDIVHKHIHTMEFHAVRARLGASGLPFVLKGFDHIIYSLCLSPLPLIKTGQDWMDYYSGILQSPCLLLEKDAETRINLMVATSRLEHGGVEKILIDLIQGLDKTRFNIILLTTSISSHPWAGLVRKAGARVYHLDRMVQEDEMPVLISKLTGIKKIDCVFIMHSVAAYYAAKHIKNNNPAVRLIDRNEVREGADDIPHCSIQIGSSFLDVRTVGHYKLAEYMAGISREPIDNYKLLYYGVLADGTNIRNVSLRDLCHAGRDDPVILFVGRLTSQKRPEIFVQIARAVIMRTGSRDLRFVMIGDGELRKAVYELIIKDNLQDCVHLLGARNDVQPLLAQATLLLMPSEYEGLALVSYEAMALGIPQIFADVNGQDELINEDTGILIRNGPGEVERYAEACITLMEDGTRRETMSTAGKARIRLKFSRDAFVAGYVDLFNNKIDRNV